MEASRAEAVSDFSVSIDNQYSLGETGWAFATRPVNSQAKPALAGRLKAAS